MEITFWRQVVYQDSTPAAYILFTVAFSIRVLTVVVFSL